MQNKLVTLQDQLRAIEVTLNVTVNDATTTTVTMARGTAFTTTIDGVSYQYVTNKAVSITPTDGVYTFSNVDVYEGSTFRQTNILWILQMPIKDF